MILIPIFINRKRLEDFEVASMTTFVEKVWVWLVILFSILNSSFIIGMYFGLSHWFAISALIGGFLMNVIMVIICCKEMKLSRKIENL